MSVVGLLPLLTEQEHLVIQEQVPLHGLKPGQVLHLQPGQSFYLDAQTWYDDPSQGSTQTFCPLVAASENLSLGQHCFVLYLAAKQQHNNNLLQINFTSQRITS